jgi:hypothetical protein
MEFLGGQSKEVEGLGLSCSGGGCELLGLWMAEVARDCRGLSLLDHHALNLRPTSFLTGQLLFLPQDWRIVVTETATRADM